MRKYSRTSSRIAAAALMVKTGMRANVLSHLAIFLVEEVRCYPLSCCCCYSVVTMLI